MTNNNPGFDAFDVNGNANNYTVFYTPVVTFVSTALNDPLAIDPSTGHVRYNIFA